MASHPAQNRAALIDRARRTGVPVGRAKAEEWLAEIPVNGWSIDLELRSEELQQVLAHWAGLAGNDTCPRHEKLYLPDIGEAVEHAFILEVAADSAADGKDDYCCLYIGRGLTEKAGVDNTGQLLSECMPPLFVKQYRAINRIARCWRKPLRGVGNFGDWQGRSDLVFESLVMPLSEDGELVTRVFTCLHFTR